MPPDGVAVAVPLEPPLQFTVVLLIETVIPEVLATVTVCVRGHPLAPVTVTVYVPAHRLDAVAPVPPLGAHE